MRLQFHSRLDHENNWVLGCSLGLLVAVYSAEDAEDDAILLDTRFDVFDPKDDDGSFFGESSNMSSLLMILHCIF